MDYKEVISRLTNFVWEMTFARMGSFVAIGSGEVQKWMHALWRIQLFPSFLAQFVPAGELHNC